MTRTAAPPPVPGAGDDAAAGSRTRSEATTSEATTPEATTPVTTAPETTAPETTRSDTAYASSFLVFMVAPVVVGFVAEPRRGGVALALTAIFCAWYVAGYLCHRAGPARGLLAWVRRIGPYGWLAGLVVLTAALTAAVGPIGLMGLTYVSVGCAAMLPSRAGLAGIALCMLGYLPPAVALGTEPVWAIGLALWVGLIGLMVWGAVRLSRSQEALVAAREERAALAVDLERERLARDLHDILGHSLTVVAVKAQLAGRLVDADPARARAEIADIERLARDALADVRTTVSGYRAPSLPAELAAARRALAAAGITAHVPGAADEVRSDLRELFAWVVREGVTNVVRHSGATTCTITLAAACVEVRDDGPTRGPLQPGNGLVGLTERARLAGAGVTVGAISPHGVCLRAAALPAAPESTRPERSGPGPATEPDQPDQTKAPDPTCGATRPTAAPRGDLT